jgi:signal transduction histidine kinase/PAS domain-containing protein
VQLLQRARQLLRRTRGLFGRTSLLFRVLALVSLGLVVIFSGFVVLGLHWVQDSQSRTRDERQVIAELTAQNLYGRLSQMAQLAAVEAVGFPTEGGDQAEQTRSYWYALRVQLGSVAQRVIELDANGRVLWSSPYDPTILGTDISKTPAWNRLAEGRDAVIGDSESLIGTSPLLIPRSTAAVLAALPPPSGGLVLVIVDPGQLTGQATADDLQSSLYKMGATAISGAIGLPTEGGDQTEQTRSYWRGLRVNLGPAAQSVVRIDDGGRILWTSPYDPTVFGLDLSGSPGVQQVLRSEGIVVGDSLSLLGSSPLLAPRPTASILAPLSPPERGAALILADLTQPGISELLQQVAPGETGSAEILSDNGVVLASTRPERVGKVGGDNGGVTASATLPGTPLSVAVHQASGEAFASADTMFRHALVFGGVFFVVAAIVSWLIVVRMVRPVKVLTDACVRIAQGDLEEPVRAMGGGEIGVLAGAFEAMRGRLKASQEEIRRWGQQLEEKVLQRTAELREARNNLERSRDYLITLFNTMEDQLAVIDKDYRVVEANRALLRRRGEEGSLVGHPCYLALRGPDEACGLWYGGCPARAVWRTGQPARTTQAHHGASGQITYLDIVVAPIKDGQGQVVTVLEAVRDVSDSKRMEEQTIRMSEELSALVSLSSAMARSMDLPGILGLALDLVLDLLDARAGGIFIGVENGKDEPITVCRGLDPERFQKLVGSAKRPEDRLDIGRVQYDGSDLACVPIATREKVLGEMFIACAPEACFGDTRLQLLVSIGSQLAVAIENARLYEAVRRKEEASSTFLRQYIAVQEEERKRIARELHDEPAQLLTGLALAIGTASQLVVADDGELRRALGSARALTERVSTEIGRIIRDLRPTLLDDLGLLEALESYADTRLRPSGIQVTFETVGADMRLPPELETALFRVAQEAMSNIARHARAENVSLTLEVQDGLVAIDIEDDGQGFDVEATFARGEGGSPFGLMGMRERVDLLGGTLVVESRPGEGTSVGVRVPLQSVSHPKGVRRNGQDKSAARRRPRDRAGGAARHALPQSGRSGRRRGG